MAGRAPTAVATLCATISETLRRSASMSIRAISLSASSGKLRMSPRRFLAKTVLPAPIMAIFGMRWVLSGWSQLSLPCRGAGWVFGGGASTYAPRGEGGWRLRREFDDDPPRLRSISRLAHGDKIPERVPVQRAVYHS